MPSQITKSEQESRSPQGQPAQSSVPQRKWDQFGSPLTPSEFFRMDPFSLMRRMSQDFNRFLGDWGGREEERIWSPAIEVKQQDGQYTVRADLPGLKPEDVKLEVTDDAIILQGERKSEHEETKGGMKVCERQYGRFYRAIPLPEGAKADQAKARFENGVLEITVPAEEARAQRRQIQIETGASATPGHKAA